MGRGGMNWRQRAAFFAALTKRSEPAGVGEARPAEPPCPACEDGYVCRHGEGCLLDEVVVGAPAEEQPDARTLLAAANREAGEYRRMWEETLTKLDVATGALKQILATGAGNWTFTNLHAVARAALGVVAAGADPESSDE